MAFSFLDKLIPAVEAARERMFAAEKRIWSHPETGYREWKTSEYMRQQFVDLGYEPVMAGNIPGFYADLDTGRPGPTVALMGELDSVICSTHPERDMQTGAVHACGHHAQCAALLGAAAALKDPEILQTLSGKIRLMAVPAEELLELEFREDLRRQGIIKYFGGKVEFLYRGYFDGVAAAVMLHTGGGKGTLSLSPGSNGCILKNIAFEGRAAHAGGSPHNGINALYAANVGLSAINALRETFRDSDHIRVHPIVTSKPGAVNVIPDRVTLESYVRGATMDAFVGVNKRVNRALAGSAAALGANVSLSDRPGYMPVRNDQNVYDLSKQVMLALVGEENVHESSEWDTGCTDMGDISCVIPAIHPSGSGAQGAGHGMDYKIADPESACTLAAKYMAAICCALLESGGAAAEYISLHRHTLFATKEDYFKAVDAVALDRRAVEYGEDGKITLNFC